MCTIDSCVVENGIHYAELVTSVQQSWNKYRPFLLNVNCTGSPIMLFYVSLFVPMCAIKGFVCLPVLENIYLVRKSLIFAHSIGEKAPAISIIDRYFVLRTSSYKSVIMKYFNRTQSLRIECL